MFHKVLCYIARQKLLPKLHKNNIKVKVLRGWVEFPTGGNLIGISESPRPAFLSMEHSS